MIAATAATAVTASAVVILISRESSRIVIAMVGAPLGEGATGANSGASAFRLTQTHRDPLSAFARWLDTCDHVTAGQIKRADAVLNPSQRLADQ